MKKLSADLKPAFGKWILAGEHAVIRGGPALVFPLYKRRISIKYDSTGEQELKVQFSGEHGNEIEILFWALLERACENLNVRRVDLKGRVSIESNLPVGAGLGASAALCVSTTRFLIDQGLVADEELYSFSRDLEDLFHGESSGVDVAASMSDHGIEFVKNKPTRSVQMNWKPNWYISYCGQRGITKECVMKVKNLESTHPDKFALLDDQMICAVKLAKEALNSGPDIGFHKMARSINLARECFHGWGLDDGALGEHLKTLEKLGAAAVKPTGSGGGGFVLSLWEHSPPPEFLQMAIELND